MTDFFEGTLVQSRRNDEIFCIRVVELDDGERVMVNEPLTPDGAFEDIELGQRVKVLFKQLVLTGQPALPYYRVAPLA